MIVYVENNNIMASNISKQITMIKYYKISNLIKIKIIFHSLIFNGLLTGWQIKSLYFKHHTLQISVLLINIWKVTLLGCMLRISNVMGQLLLVWVLVQKIIWDWIIKLINRKSFMCNCKIVHCTFSEMKQGKTTDMVLEEQLMEKNTRKKPLSELALLFVM